MFVVVGPCHRRPNDAGRRCRTIEHDDAAIAVAVRDVDFVGILVDRSLRGLTELGGVVGAPGRRDLADLAEELAVEGEFEDGVVVVGIAADPDETAVVDFDAVLAADPFIAFAGPAQEARRLAVGIELQHRRRRHAAFRARRIERCALFVVGERARALDDPDMSLAVDGDAADLADDPVVRQRLRPGGVDREGRDAVRGSGVGKMPKADAARQRQRLWQNDRACGRDWASASSVPPRFSWLAAFCRLARSQSRGGR